MSAKKDDKNLVDRVRKFLAEKLAFLKERPRLRYFLVIALVLGVLYLLRSFFVAAIVNGQPITRLSVISQLEKTGGQQALDGLVTESLIFQEARKRGVSISDQEVDNSILELENNIKEQGQDLDVMLSYQGMTRDDLTYQIRLQKLLEKMLEDKVAISNEEVDQYLEENKELLPENTSPEDLRVMAQDNLRQTKFSTEVQNFLAEIKNSASIYYFVSY